VSLLPPNLGKTSARGSRPRTKCQMPNAQKVKDGATGSPLLVVRYSGLNHSDRSQDKTLPHHLQCDEKVTMKSFRLLARPASFTARPT
jgi:hypothetical protein